MNLENNGNGKNITLQVLDAIMCHNGEFVLGKYEPINKTKEEFIEEYKQSYIDKNKVKSLRPMTLEGCVVRISDVIGYIGKDIEDAIILGIISKDEIPENITKVLGDNNRDIINTIVNDIIKNSINKPYIQMSEEVFKALIDLKKFNYENIYAKANTQEEIKSFEVMFNTLFDKYLEDIKNKNVDSNIYTAFLNDMNDNYLKETSNERKAIDFIAGMTDDYFIKCYKNTLN